MKTYKYKGALGEDPTITPAWLEAAIRQDDDAAQTRIQNELFRDHVNLVLLLARDCGDTADSIAEIDWRRMALKLAGRHVPAFGPLQTRQQTAGRGRPRKNTLDDDLDLYWKITEKISGGKQESVAISSVHGKVGKGQTKDAFESRYRRTKGKVMRAMDFLAELQGRLSQK